MSSYEIASVISTMMCDMEPEIQKDFLLAKLGELLEKNYIKQDDINTLLSQVEHSQKTEYDIIMEQLENVCEQNDSDLQDFMCEISKGNHDYFCFNADEFKPFLSSINEHKNIASYIIEHLIQLLEDYNDVYDCFIDQQTNDEMVKVLMEISKYDICKVDREKCDELIQMYGKKD